MKANSHISGFVYADNRYDSVLPVSFPVELFFTGGMITGAGIELGEMRKAVRELCK